MGREKRGKVSNLRYSWAISSVAEDLDGHVILG